MNINNNIFRTFLITAALLAFSSANVFGRDSSIHSSLSTINLEITTHLGDQQYFVDQDLISFFISLDNTAYIYAFYQDAKGKIYQLIPGLAQSENLFQAGIYMPFPAESSTFQFYVQEPFGKETIWVYASDKAGLKFRSYTSNNSIKQTKLTLKQIEDIIKSSSKKFYDSASTVINTKKQR